LDTQTYSDNVGIIGHVFTILGTLKLTECHRARRWFFSDSRVNIISLHHELLHGLALTNDGSGAT